MSQSSSSGRSKSQGAKQKASALEATNPVQPPKPQYDESQFFDIAEAHVADITDYAPPPVIEVRPEPSNAVLPEVRRKKIVNTRKAMYNRGSANVPVLQNPLPVHEQPTVQSTSSAEELPFHSHSATPTDRLHTPMGPTNVVPAAIYESPRRSSASSHQTYTPEQHRPMVEVVQQPPHPPLPPQQQMPMHQPMVAPQTPVPTSPVVQRQPAQQQPMPQQPMQYVQYAPEQQQSVPMYPMNYMPAPNDQRAHQYPPQYPPHFVASSSAGYYPQQQQQQPPPQQMYVYRQHANVYPAYVRQAAPPPRQVVRIVRRAVAANMQPAPMPRHPPPQRAYAPRPMSNSPYCIRPPHPQYTQPTTPVQSAPLRQPLQVTPPMHRTPSPVVHYPPQSLVYYPNQPAVSHAYMAEQQRAAYQVSPYGYPPNVSCPTPYMPPPPPVERHEPQPQYVNQTPPAPMPHTSDTQAPMADLFEADNPDDIIQALRVANDDVPVDSLHATATFGDADFMSYFVPPARPAAGPSTLRRDLVLNPRLRNSARCRREESTRT
ncbi:hypothetical protein M3Y99_00312700 [Aphelenchoides fujianensis]|nr:hypothetical protein M3Y99_00312700 [Aphelenchoides fujianensis]